MWRNDSLKKILVDIHHPEWHDEIHSRFDAVALVDAIVQTGAETALIHAKPHTGYSLFKTEVGRMNQALKGRDIFGEFVHEAKKRDLTVGGYYSVTWDNSVFKTHPEWRMIDNNGEELGWDPLFYKAVCYLNSGYRDFIFEQVKELASNYPVDGFWFDILLYDSLRLGCYCDGCQARFREETGLETIPTTPTWDAPWREFLEFRYRQLQEFAEETIEVAKGVNPDLAIGFNYHGTPGFSWKSGHRPVQHAQFSDYASGEIYPYCFGYFYPSLLTKYLHGVKETGTHEILTNMAVSSCDYTMKPVEQLRWEGMTTLSNGLAFNVWDELYHDGTFNKTLYSRIGEVFREIDEKQDLWGGTALKETAIYFSGKTRDYYGRETPGDYTLAFYGAYRALFETHRQIGILFDENITLEKLKSYPIVLLPNVAILDDEEVEMFTQYVEQGGNLVATDDTSLYDCQGQLEDFRLAHLFGASFRNKTNYSYNYVSFEDDPIGQGIAAGERFLCAGKGSVIEATAPTYGQLWSTFFDREPDRFFLGVHPPHEVLGPAVVTNSYGQGKVVYCPFRLFAGFASDHAVAELRTIAGNILDSFGHRPTVEVQAPLTAEAVVREQAEKNRIVVHLVGFNHPFQSVATGEGGSLNEKTVPLMEEPPLFKAQLSIRVPYKKVSTFSPNTTVTEKEGQIEVLCDRVHDAVIIEL